VPSDASDSVVWWSLRQNHWNLAAGLQTALLHGCRRFYSERFLLTDRTSRMLHSLNASARHKSVKKRYRIMIWSRSNQTLASVTVWFSVEAEAE
jgi:hypothetical protein